MKNDAAQIYGSAFPANVKNLYIVGSNQPRNGFGNIITPAAALYARLIEMQDEIEHPDRRHSRVAGRAAARDATSSIQAPPNARSGSRTTCSGSRLQARRLARRGRWHGPPAEFIADITKASAAPLASKDAAAA